ncbi:MAG TPA: coenzyme F420-0:L-glutamate ligase [Lentisphaeria bacterium]|nr:coenzyme F420-0:L-glutamate ligase [Lentisphaeria bacterium]
MRTIGTQVRGIRCPIFRPGDDLAERVIDALLTSCKQANYQLNDRDVLGITESAVARTQGNFITADQIAKDVRSKFPSGEIGVTFPILSRNRFAVILQAIARGVDKVHLLFSYPADEVGNHLMDPEVLDRTTVNPYTDVLDEKRYRELFGAKVLHPFTGIDYVDLYKEIVGADKAEIHFANDVCAILPFSRQVLTADIHSRARSKRRLQAAGAEIVLGLDDLCTTPVEPGAGYNADYGLLGSNKSDDEEVKLFPRDCQTLVERIQARLLELTGKRVEVMVYGDGAFKDPVGKIWELADPVVSPGFTAGLRGTPHEVKLKYLADEMQKKTKDDAVVNATIQERLRDKKNTGQVGEEESLGTTPRQLTDLLGSLCDLTSGSGDKGTPVVLIQGYFDCLADD